MTRPAPRHEEDNLAVQFAESGLTVTAVPNHHHWQEDDIAYNHLITAVRAEWSSTG
jgi:hypothetical protein